MVDLLAPDEFVGLICAVGFCRLGECRFNPVFDRLTYIGAVVVVRPHILGYFINCLDVLIGLIKFAGVEDKAFQILTLALKLVTIGLGVSWLLTALTTIVVAAAVLPFAAVGIPVVVIPPVTPSVAVITVIIVIIIVVGHGCLLLS